MNRNAQYILNFSDINREDLALAGFKGRALGELAHFGFPIIDGFIISSTAYFQTLKENNILTKIQHLLSLTDFNSPESLLELSLNIKKYILRLKLSKEFLSAIYSSFSRLTGALHDQPVSLTPSYTTDMHRYSENPAIKSVTGDANLIIKLTELWAMMFDAQQIYLYHKNKINYAADRVAVIIQKVLNYDASGLIYTSGLEGDNKRTIIIQAVKGSFDVITHGKASPDTYAVDKKALLISSKDVMPQKFSVNNTDGQNKKIKLLKNPITQQKITDQQILYLASQAEKLEQFCYFPQEITWALKDGRFYFINIKPITPDFSIIANNTTSFLIAKGQTIFPGMTTGKVRILSNDNKDVSLKPGEITVMKLLSLKNLNLLKKASAILIEDVINDKLLLSSLKNSAIPSMHGIDRITQSLKEGQIITVNATKASIYKGSVYPAKRQVNKNSSSRKHASKIFIDFSSFKVNSDNPNTALNGLAGVFSGDKFIEQFAIHPKKLVADAKDQIFIDQLSQILAKIAALLKPEPLIYRASDLSVTDYLALNGGKVYESLEKNELLGYHGSVRHLNDTALFMLEMKAVKKARNSFGKRNIWLMVPFLRSVNEYREIKQLLSSLNLHRTPSFKIWATIATPANIYELDKFLEENIDGIALDVDYLYQLTYGIDLGNIDVTTHLAENEELLYSFVENAVKKAAKHNLPVIISKRKSSEKLFPIEKFISLGINGICIAENTLEQVEETIIRTERKIVSF